MPLMKNSAAKATPVKQAKTTPVAAKATAKTPAAKTTAKVAAVDLTQTAPTSEDKQVVLGRKQVAERICAKVKATGKAVPLSIAEAMLDSFEEIVAEAMVNEEAIRLSIGKFFATQVGEREARNPATGDVVMVAAHLSPKFKPSSTLKRALNAGTDPEGENSPAEAAAEA